ncbi:MAG: hypothetical protein ABUL43_03375 [Hyphomicrobium sp.]
MLLQRTSKLLAGGRYLPTCIDPAMIRREARDLLSVGAPTQHSGKSQNDTQMILSGCFLSIERLWHEFS